MEPDYPAPPPPRKVSTPGRVSYPDPDDDPDYVTPFSPQDPDYLMPGDVESIRHSSSSRTLSGDAPPPLPPPRKLGQRSMSVTEGPEINRLQHNRNVSIKHRSEPAEEAPPLPERPQLPPLQNAQPRTRKMSLPNLPAYKPQPPSQNKNRPLPTPIEDEEHGPSALLYNTRASFGRISAYSSSSSSSPSGESLRSLHGVINCDNASSPFVIGPYGEVTFPKPRKRSSLELTEFAWYHKDCDRTIAYDRIMVIPKNGTFLIRPRAEDQKECKPYALQVYQRGKCHALLIRLRTDETYALGKEKQGERTFASLPELVEYHRNNYIMLENEAEGVLLKEPAPVPVPHFH